MIGIGRRSIFVAATLLAGAAFAAPASAQATRTWVSGVGDDANPCSRTAPCKTFAGAISKTAAGGEINCLDPGGFGAVTITKSMTIYCPYTEAGVLAPGTTGIVINNASARVVLDGLDIHGGGTGTAGIRVVAARSVIVRNSTIQGFQSSNGRGISVEGEGQVIVAGSTIVHNRTGIAGAVLSAGNNLLALNDTDGNFQSTVPLK